MMRRVIGLRLHVRAQHTLPRTLSSMPWKVLPATHAQRIRDSSSSREALSEYGWKHARTFDVAALAVWLDACCCVGAGAVDGDLVSSVCDMVVVGRRSDAFAKLRAGWVLDSVLRSLATLQCRPSDEFIRIWLEQCEGQMGEMLPASLTRLMGALADLGYVVSPAFLASWGRACMRAMEDFMEMELLEIVRALAVMKVERAHLGSPEFFVHWGTEMGNRLNAARLLDISSWLCALQVKGSELGSHFSASWGRCCASVPIAALLGNSKVEELINFLRILCEMRPPLPPQFLPDLMALSEARRASCSPAEWKSLEHVTESILVVAGRRDLIASWRVMTIAPVRHMDAIKEMQSIDALLDYSALHAGHFSPVEIAACVGGCARAASGKFKATHREALQRLCLIWEPSLRAMNARSLATVLHGLGKLDVTPSPSFVSLWFSRSLQEMASMNAQDLVMALYGVSHLGFNKDTFPGAEEWLSKWSSVSEAQAPHFTPQGMAMIFRELFALKPPPNVIGPSFFLVLSQCCTALFRAMLVVPQPFQSTPVFSPQALIHVARGIESLGLLESEGTLCSGFSDLWLDATILQLSSFDADELADGLAAVAAAKFLQAKRDAVTRFYHQWERAYKACTSLKPRHRVIVHQARLKLEQSHGINVGQMAATEPVLPTKSAMRSLRTLDELLEYGSAQSESFDASSFASFLSACLRVGRQVRLTPGQQEIILRICHRGVHHLASLDGRALSTLLHAISVLRVALSAEFMRAWSLPCSRHLVDMNQISLYNIIVSLSEMGCDAAVVGLPFFQQWALSMTAEKLFLLEDSQQVASILRALSKLNLGSAQLIATSFFENWSACCIDRMPAMTGQALANILVAAGNLELQEQLPLHFWRVWGECCLLQHASMKLNDLVMVLHWMGDSHANVVEAVGSPVLSAVTGALKNASLSSVDASSVLRALARLRHKAPRLHHLLLDQGFFLAWSTNYAKHISARDVLTSHLVPLLQNLSDLHLGADALVPDFFEDVIAECDRRMYNMPSNELVLFGKWIAQESSAVLPHGFPSSPSIITRWIEACSAKSSQMDPLLREQAVGIASGFPASASLVQALRQGDMMMNGAGSLASQIGGASTLEDLLILARVEASRFSGFDLFTFFATLIRIMRDGTVVTETSRDTILSLCDVHWMEKLVTCDARSLTTMLTGLSRLGGRPSDVFLSCWFAAALQQISHMNAVELVSLLMAVSRLGLVLEGDLSAQWFRICFKRLTTLTDWSPSLLCDCVVAVSRLEMSPPREWLLDWSRVATPQLEDFSRPQLCSTLGALARLGVLSRRSTLLQASFVPTWIGCATRAIPQMSSAELVLILRSFATTSGSGDGALSELCDPEFLVAWGKAACVVDFSEKSLLSVIQSLALLELRPKSVIGAEVFLAWSDSTKRIMDSCSAENLVGWAWWGVAVLGLEKPDLTSQWAEQWWGALVSRSVATLGPHDLARIPRIVATLKRSFSCDYLGEDRFFAHFSDSVSQHLAEFDADEKASLLEGLKMVADAMDAPGSPSWFLELMTALSSSPLLGARSFPVSHHAEAMASFKALDDVLSYASRHLVHFTGADLSATLALSWQLLATTGKAQLSSFQTPVLWSICDAVETRFSELNAKDLSSIINALYRLRMKPSSQFVKGWSGAYIREIAYVASAQSLVTTLVALSELGFGEAQVDSRFFPAWVAACSSRMSSLDSTALASLIKAVARIDLDPQLLAGTLFFSVWSKQCASQLQGSCLPASYASILYGIGRIVKQRGIAAVASLDEGLFTQWAAGCVQVLPRMDGHHLDEVIFGLAQVGAQVFRHTGPGFDKVFYQLWAQTLAPLIPRLNAQNLVNIIRSMTRLGLGPMQLGLSAHQFFQEWSRGCVAQFKSKAFTAEGVSFLIWSLGKLDLSQEQQHEFLVPEFYGHWTVVCASLLSSMRSSELVNTIYGLGQLGLREEKMGIEFFNAWTWCVALQIGHLNELELTSIIRSLARLDLGPEKLGADFFSQWSMLVKERLDQNRFNARCLALLIWSIFKLKLHSESDLMTLWIQACTQRMGEMSARDLSIVLHSLGEILGASVAEPFRPLLHQWLQCCTTKLVDCSPRELGTMMRSLGKLDLTNEATLLQPFLLQWSVVCIEALQMGPANFSPQTLANMIWGVSRLAPSQFFGAGGGGDHFCAIWSHVCTSRISATTNQELVMIGSAIARLQLPATDMHPKFYSTWTRSCTQRLDRLNPTELVILLSAISQHSAFHAILSASFFLRWIKACRSHTAAAFSAQELATMRDHVSAIELLHSGHFNDAFRASWHDFVSGVA